MKIDNEKLDLLLNALAEVYPYFPSTEYMEGLIDDIGGDDVFDGHMLYLKDKGLIISDMKWDSESEKYWLSPADTRISCIGLDYLAAN
ncbi:MAG: hypothetical protein RR970_00790 [Hafnia sp.]